MNKQELEKWIEDYQCEVDESWYGIDVDDLRELLKTHAIVPVKQELEWISVEDEMPNPDDDLLLCNADENSLELGYMRFNKFYAGFIPHSLSMAEVMHNATDNTLDDVTHWMPVPKLPKTSEEV